MTLAEHGSPRANGHGGLLSKIPWPNGEMFENLARSPRVNLPLKDGKRIELFTDRVRAKPALSPTVSMNIGVTAIGLGLWGTLFPKHVARTLGIRAPTPVVRTLFGLRELWTGYTLAGDPTKSQMLWTRVAGDIFDIAVLTSLDRPSNPQRGTARAALGFVIAVTALDAITAVRMSAVQRNCA